MKLSLDWISEFVDLTGIDAGELANKLTVHTAEVDEVTELTRSVDRVVVAKVVRTSALDGSTQAKTAEIDVGGRILTVVCAAPNVREGLVTLAAMPGAVLARQTSTGRGSRNLWNQLSSCGALLRPGAGIGLRQ